MITKLFAAIGVIAIALYLWGAINQPPSPPRSSFNYSAALSTPTSHQVVYRMRVRNCLTFDITYRLPSGTAQKDVTVCPGEDRIARFTGSAGDFVYLSAQNTNQVFTQSPFACQILVDGMIVAEIESQGFAKIASCSGSVR